MDNRLPLITGYRATFHLRDSIGPWLGFLHSHGIVSSILAVQKRSLDKQNFLYFLRFLLKVASLSLITQHELEVELFLRCPWLTLWILGTFIICSLSSASQMSNSLIVQIAIPWTAMRMEYVIMQIVFATEVWIYPGRNCQKTCMNLNLYTLSCSEPTNNKLKALSHKL